MNQLTTKLFDKENMPLVSNNNDLLAINRLKAQSLSQIDAKPKTQKQIISQEHINEIKLPQVPSLQRKVMQECSNQLFAYFGQEQIAKQKFLKNHSITPMLRSKMVDWMIEVLTSYKCSNQTFFITVNLIDSFLQFTSKQHTPHDLHLVGVTCMFMAAKFEEIYPIKLNILQEKIAHNKLSKDQILEKEAEICIALDFKLIRTTVFEVVTLVLSKLNLISQEKQKVYTHLFKTAVYIAKMVSYDYELVTDFKNYILAAAICIVAFKILQQVESTFNADSYIKSLSDILSLGNDEMMEAANRVLQLAKNFDKQFPSYQNLKKFNKFSYED